MIERVRIADIMTPADEVIFYDPTIKEDYKNFCIYRDIDYLPSLEDPNGKIYCKGPDGTFEGRKIKNDLRVDANLDIFSEEALRKLRNNKVVFVYNYGEFCGVVHFSDYNKYVVTIFLYKLISQYEIDLRNLLIIKGYSDDSMIEYFNYKIEKEKKDEDKEYYKNKISNYNERRKSSINQFQIFEINDLVSLVNNKIKYKLTDIKGLRNSIMHLHQLVNKIDVNYDDLHFNQEEFEQLIKNILSLKKDSRKIKTILILSQ